LRRSGLEGSLATLAAVGPPAVLRRGYALVTVESGEVVRSVGQLTSGQRINVRVADGHLQAEVHDIQPEDEDDE
jgi:exodeoxyribonuclease VII large subunit